MVGMVIKLTWILYQRWDDDPNIREIRALVGMIFIDVYFPNIPCTPTGVDKHIYIYNPI